MGQPMARRILAAGFPLTVTDTRADACTLLVAAGGTAATTAAALAAHASIVVTCVPGQKEVDALFFGAEGLLATLKPGTTELEMSTIDVSLSRRIGEACAARVISIRA